MGVDKFIHYFNGKLLPDKNLLYILDSASTVLLTILLIHLLPLPVSPTGKDSYPGRRYVQAPFA